MKNIIFTLVLGSLTLVSCGPTAEEQAALEALESEKTSLEIDLRMSETSVDGWWEAFNEETDVYTKDAFAREYEKEVEIRDQIKADLAEVKFKISQLK
jgi:tRNA(Ser,Leu) C12 N-acetylase TAN1